MFIRRRSEKKKKSVIREYLEALLWAVVLALIIRTWGVQAFKIPSGSMIPALLIGAHLLVSKSSSATPSGATSWCFSTPRTGKRTLSSAS